MMKYSRFLTLFVFPASIVGCVYEDEPPRRLARDPDPVYEPAPPAQNNGGGTTSDNSNTGSATSPAPMLVEVDTDQTMTADPGQGVGVFIEYGSGGKWHIWWTCDTAKTGQECAFTVDATATAGTISNLDASQVTGGGTVSSPTASSIHAVATTANEVHGVSFTTNPGVILTVKASLGTIADGSFLFFVQDNKVNGGFTGKLSNPLQLQGKTP
jgi:hypothetical protein